VRPSSLGEPPPLTRLASGSGVMPNHGGAVAERLGSEPICTQSGSGNPDLDHLLVPHYRQLEQIGRRVGYPEARLCSTVADVAPGTWTGHIVALDSRETGSTSVSRMETQPLFPFWKHLSSIMQLMSLGTLRTFREANERARQELVQWSKIVRKATWRNFHDVRKDLRSADNLTGGWICFNIRRNEFRLIVLMVYDVKMVLVKFIGSHAQYDLLLTNPKWKKAL
jgi:mRNA interferase HigB